MGVVMIVSSLDEICDLMCGNKMPKRYFYGMRLRGFSPGAQPKGVIERLDDPSGKYYDILVYDHRLTDAETRDYELDMVGTGTT